jgi:hypothetical protein
VKSSVEILLTDSSKVTAKSMLAALAAGEPLGAMLVTLGTTPSIARSLFAPRELAAPGEARVKVAGLVAASKMVPPFKVSELVAI